MAQGSLDERAARFIDRSDPITLLLAAVSIALYLADLAGLAHGPWLPRLSGAIDMVFVVDLVAKALLLRGRYLGSPWFLIDAISCLPALSWLASLPASLAGLRAVRAFRMLRVLRALRSLRLLRTLSVLRMAGATARSRHTRRYELALTIAVLAYTVLFLALVAGLDGDPRGELNLVLGSVMGMVLVLFVVRFQMQDITHGHVRQLLSAALPVQVADHFLANPESYDKTVYMPATIIFCDIRGFTRTVEKLGGDMVTLKTHLERAMDAVVHTHLQHDLLVDKLIGDAVMSFRGGNLVPGTAREHAARAVRAALQSVRALEELDDPYFNRLKVGGASATSAMIGTFGTSGRLSYTILGDRVNLAARLEAACGQLSARNLFDTHTRALLADHADFVWRRIGRLRVPGKGEAIEAYEAFDAAEDLSWLPVYHGAVEAFEVGDFPRAQAAFEEVSRLRGEDGPSRVFWAACRHLSSHPVPKRWDGALEMAK